MGSAPRICTNAIAALLMAVSSLGPAQAQGFSADYRLSPAMPLGGEGMPGLSLQAGRNWFGQVGVSQGAASLLQPAGSHEVVNLAGGWRFSNGQSLSLQLSRGRGQGLGLAVNYDWPRYFVRFSYDQGLNLSLVVCLCLFVGLRF